GRRVHPDRSIFLHERNHRGGLGVRYQHRRAFPGRCGQITDHPALLVGVRIRNDNRRHHRSRGDLRPRPCLRSARMKSKSFIAALIVSCITSAIAETFPIVDVQYGYLIGGAENGKWIESDKAAKSVKKGAKLQVYGVTGAVGSASVVKLDTQN